MSELDKELNSTCPIKNKQDDIMQSKSKLTIRSTERNNELSDEFLILNNLSKVTIRQVITLINERSYYENNIEYQVYNGKNYILNCKEYTTCFHRKCCKYSCKNLELILFLSNQEKLAYCYQMYDRNFCLPKPYIEIKYYLGKKLFIIKEFNASCESNYRIFDYKKKLLYLIKIPYCQKGFCCRNCYFNGNKINGYLYKDGKLMMNNVIDGKKIYDRLNNDIVFNVNFLNDMNIYDKFNLIVCALLFHYKYFSITQNKRCYECKFIIIIFFIFLIIILFIFFIIFYFSKKSYGEN